jgi:hypothetical protein
MKVPAQQLIEWTEKVFTEKVSVKSLIVISWLVVGLGNITTSTTVKIIQINPPTRCNNFSSLLLDVYLQLNMFWASSRPSSGAQQLQEQPLVLPF